MNTVQRRLLMPLERSHILSLGGSKKLDTHVDNCAYGTPDQWERVIDQGNPSHPCFAHAVFVLRTEMFSNAQSLGFFIHPEIYKGSNYLGSPLWETVIQT